MTMLAAVPPPNTASQVGVFRDLHGHPVEFTYDETSFIHPDAIIDDPANVTIGRHCEIHAGVILQPAGGRIVIGDHCTIGAYTTVNGAGGVFLGDWVTIEPHCGLLAANRRFDSFEIPIARQPLTTRGIYLMGDNWVGARSTLCDDVTLGRGAVVGAGSVVTRSAPMATLVLGTPARIHRKRHDGPWHLHRTERGSQSNEMPAFNHEWIEQRAAKIGEYLNATDDVLEIGCGEGLVMRHLSKRCRRISGCDYSQEALDKASAALPGRVYKYSNVTSLRFEDQTFDAAVLSDVAEHLLHPQLERALTEAYRVLKPGGRLLLATPITGAGRNTTLYSHLYEYSRDELQSLLAQYFEKVDFCDEQFGLFVATR